MYTKTVSSRDAATEPAGTHSRRVLANMSSPAQPVIDHSEHVSRVCFVANHLVHRKCRDKFMPVKRRPFILTIPGNVAKTH